MHTYDFDFGPFTLSGEPGTADAALADRPRRTVLDKLLVDAAAAAGADVRESFVVDEILFEDGASPASEGTRRPAALSPSVPESLSVRMAGPPSWPARSSPSSTKKAPLLCGYYTYWSDLPMDGRFQTYIRPLRGFAAAQTHDGLTLVIAGWPASEFEENKKHVEQSYLSAIDRARVRGASPRGEAPGTVRRGDGAELLPQAVWSRLVLVGDAGYNKDFITAQGMLDAFRDAETCAGALDQVFTGARPFDEAMDEYQRDRDTRVLAMFEFTCQLATLEPPPPEMQQLFAAIGTAISRRWMHSCG